MKSHLRSQLFSALALSFLVVATTSLQAVTWTSISDPNAVKGTIAEDINTNGVIVGYYFDAQFNASGFLYTNGVFTTFTYPGQQSTLCMGINDLGQIVGEY